jgi:ATP synthase protein I
LAGRRRRGSRTQAGINAEAAWEAVLSIAVGMAIGYYLDRWLETEPILLLVFTVFGCVAGLRRLLKLMADTARQAEPEDTDGDSEPR